MRRALAIAALFALAYLAKAALAGDFIAATKNLSIFEAAIAAERPLFAPPPGVTGLTVPHHLLAADLIARAFWAASANSYDRVILMSPDHFHRVSGAFATTRQDLATVFGTIASDRPAVSALLARTDLFESVPDVSNEHGLHSVAPFIAKFFPGATIVPILAAVSTTPDDWRRAVDAIRPLVTERTLVVQSTDFSHYRPLSEAMVRDQESIGIVSAGDPAAVGPLLQPSHMDSKAAQFVQMALQNERGAHAVVIANRNSAEYSGERSLTTSYVVTVYLRDAAAGDVLRYPDQATVYFAGDTLLGRFLTPALRDATARSRMIGAVTDITRGAPLVVNFEGVMVDEPVIGAAPTSHIMTADLGLPLLRQLNVTAATLANNHSFDLGALGLQELQRILSANGIRPLVHDQVADLGTFRLLALNFVQSRDFLGSDHYTADAGIACDVAARPPLVAFVHWGQEYTHEPDATVRAAAQTLHDCGVGLIVGAHSHQASTIIDSLSGGATQSVYSVGNFFFDQSMPNTSGALLEVRVFKQGTIAARLVPMPNLFVLGTQAKDATYLDGLK